MGLRARVVSGVKEHAISGIDWAAFKPLVNATWELSHSATHVPVTVEPQWYPSAEVNHFYVFNDSYVSRYMPGKGWDTSIAAQWSQHSDGRWSVPRTSVYGWGHFAVFDEKTKPVNIHNATNQPSINLYPNPTHDEGNLNINLQQPATLTVIVSDILGRKVYATNPTLFSTGTSIIKLPMQQYATGTYFVLLKDNNGIPLWSGKLQKQ